jgi:hypothetical protein
MICNLEASNINNLIKNEKLEVCVVSYGGCCSGSLVKTLEQNGYKCMTDIQTKILSHCPIYIDLCIPIIYIYDNPIKSFLSMKKRGDGIWNVNQKKLSNDYNTNLSDENLLSLIINQFNNWTNIKRDNVLILKSSELFEDNVVNKLEIFLNTKLKNFPLKYIEPKTNPNNISDETLINLFEKYKNEIDCINNFTNFDNDVYKPFKLPIPTSIPTSIPTTNRPKPKPKPRLILIQKLKPKKVSNMFFFNN